MRLDQGTHNRLRLARPEYLFCAAWCTGVLAAQIRLFDVQTTWSSAAWIVMAAVPISFVAGARLGRALIPVATHGPAAHPEYVNRTRTRQLLCALTAVGLAEVVHQYAGAGFVPLLSANIDQARTTLPGGPSIALVNCLHVSAIVAIATPRRLLARSALPELALAAIALLALMSFGGRGTVLAPVAVAGGVRLLVHARPKLSVVLTSAALVAALASLLFFVRTAQPPTAAFETELYGSVIERTPTLLRPAIPLHIALAMNFEALARVVAHFPETEPFGAGAFDAHALEFIVPGTRDLSAVSSRLTPPWVVSTMAGPLWADGGLIVVVLGVLLVGCATAITHQLWQRARSLRTALLYSYVLYLALFGVYQNFWTQYIDWVLVAPLLFICGAMVVSDPVQPVAALVRRQLSVTSSALSRGIAAMPNRILQLGREHGLAAALASAALLVSLAAILVANGAVDSTARDGGADAARLPFAVVDLRPEIAQDAVLVADSDTQEDNTPLYAIDGGTTRRVVRLARDSRAAYSTHFVTTVVVGRRPRPTFDVAKWKTSGAALFTMWQQAQRTFVQISDLQRRGSRLAMHAATTGAIPSGSTRKFAVATWSGDSPDLFVIDYGTLVSRPQIRVFSGESGFRSEIFAYKPQLLGVTARSWSVDVGRALGRRPDLVLIKRSTKIKRVEFHVLTGDAGYRRFVYQRPTRLRAPAAPGERFTLAQALGSPAIVERTSHRGLRVTPLTPLRTP